MENHHGTIRGALQEGRADQALRAIDAASVGDRADPEMIELRLQALLALGQFELARDTALILGRLRPGHPAVPAYMETVERVLAAPPVGSTEPQWRSYRSEVPTEFLQRMQTALHHQTYAGVQIVKSPFDLMVYQQLVFRVRPGTIVEIGSKSGGSGLFFGDLLRNFDIDGHVLSYDLLPAGVRHPLVTFAYGNGRRMEDVLGPEEIERLPRPLLVIEDADHTCETTLAVLRFFHPHLQVGDWIVIEDGNLSSIVPEVYPDYSSGPHLALREFFRMHARAYRIAAELVDMYAYNATTSSNGILERIPERVGETA